jgi:p-aminobenzoyl-glutamate transporter AbgT
LDKFNYLSGNEKNKNKMKKLEKYFEKFKMDLNRVENKLNQNFILFIILFLLFFFYNKLKNHQYIFYQL